MITIINEEKQILCLDRKDLSGFHIEQKDYYCNLKLVFKSGAVMDIKIDCEQMEEIKKILLGIDKYCI
jgi:hypothetical protein